MFICLHTKYSWFCSKTAKPSSCNRGYTVHKAGNIYYFALNRKSSLTPELWSVILESVFTRVLPASWVPSCLFWGLLFLFVLSCANKRKRNGEGLRYLEDLHVSKYSFLLVPGERSPEGFEPFLYCRQAGWNRMQKNSHIVTLQAAIHFQPNHLTLS